MLEHIFFPVSTTQFDAIAAFYLAALAPLGYTEQIARPGLIGLGTGKGDVPFWITAKDDAALRGVHIAFRARDHETVDKFYGEAVKAGGIGDGEPGLRTKYRPDYYAAFVLDPIGNSVEIAAYGSI